jgi:hypothetical protein
MGARLFGVLLLGMGMLVAAAWWGVGESLASAVLAVCAVALMGLAVASARDGG